MKRNRLDALYLLSIFLLFLVILLVVIFSVLVGSGIVSINPQPLSVTGFSCTAAGTYVDLQKSAAGNINITSIKLYTKSSEITINAEYTVDSKYFNIHLPYRCLISDSVSSVKIFYAGEISAEKQQYTLNFFSKLISESGIKLS